MVARRLGREEVEYWPRDRSVIIEHGGGPDELSKKLRRGGCRFLRSTQFGDGLESTNMAGREGQRRLPPAVNKSPARR